MSKPKSEAARSSEVHSFRCSPEVWNTSRRRAAHEEVTVNFVISELLEGYARGLIDLPKVEKRYSPVKQIH